jgi:hypothetical protein
MRQSYTLKILKDAKVRGDSKAGDIITTLLDTETLQIQLDAGNVEVIGDAIPAEPEPTPEPREPGKPEAGSSKPKGRGHSKGTS